MRSLYCSAACTLILSFINNITLPALLYLCISCIYESTSLSAPEMIILYICDCYYCLLLYWSVRWLLWHSHFQDQEKTQLMSDLYMKISEQALVLQWGGTGEVQVMQQLLWTHTDRRLQRRAGGERPYVELKALWRCSRWLNTGSSDENVARVTMWRRLIHMEPRKEEEGGRKTHWCIYDHQISSPGRLPCFMNMH